MRTKLIFCLFFIVLNSFSNSFVYEKNQIFEHLEEDETESIFLAKSHLDKKEYKKAFIEILILKLKFQHIAEYRTDNFSLINDTINSIIKNSIKIKESFSGEEISKMTSLLIETYGAVGERNYIVAYQKLDEILKIGLLPQKEQTSNKTPLVQKEESNEPNNFLSEKERLEAEIKAAEAAEKKAREERNKKLALLKQKEEEEEKKRLAQIEAERKRQAELEAKKKEEEERLARKKALEEELAKIKAEEERVAREKELERQKNAEQEKALKEQEEIERLKAELAKKQEALKIAEKKAMEAEKEKAKVVSLNSINNIQAPLYSYDIERDLLSKMQNASNNNDFRRLVSLSKYLEWQIKARKLCNSGDYDRANELFDTILVAKNAIPELNTNNSNYQHSNSQLKDELQKVELCLTKSLLDRCVFIQNKIRMLAYIEYNRIIMDVNGVTSNKLKLEEYVKMFEGELNSTIISRNLNQDRINDLKSGIYSGPVYQEELRLREKVENSVNKGRFLSAVSYKSQLDIFLANPKVTEKPEVTEPVTENQKRIVWLETNIKNGRKTGNFDGLYELEQELKIRLRMEEEIKKGNYKNAAKIEKEINQISAYE